MKSLFNKADNLEIQNRINALTADSAAQWGKMNVIQMLAHCQAPLKVAFGDLELKRGLMAILFGSMYKKKLTKDASPFQRNLPTDKMFIISKQSELELATESKKLIDLVNRFQLDGPEAITKNTHPFFGTLTPKEWDIIQWKHLDHHLNQFGA